MGSSPFQGFYQLSIRSTVPEEEEEEEEEEED
jgi:hypothetical protein